MDTLPKNFTAEWCKSEERVGGAIIKGWLLIEAGSVESLIHGVIYMYKGRSGQTFCTEQITCYNPSPSGSSPFELRHQ